MTAADTLVVVNPASAAGRTGRQWPAVRSALDAAGVDFDHRLTTAAGEATEITRAALHAGVGRVVAVGGDGTLNEVLNGFLTRDGRPERPGAILGMIPSGTGGDFRRTANIPIDVRSAAALLARGDRRPCDVGRIEYLDADGAILDVRHFVNIADCGLGGEVVARVNASAKSAGGRLTFLYHSLRAVAAFGRRPVRLEVDGIPLGGPVQNVVFANGRYFGSGMMVAPDADVADGLLDVIVIGDISRLRGLLETRHIYAGRHVGRPGVLVIRGRRAVVRPVGGAELLFDVEGEQFGSAPAAVTVLPAAILLCAPAPRVA